MKRDMDLIREILFRLEEIGEGESTLPPLSDLGYSREKIGYHNYLLVDADLAFGYTVGRDSDVLPLCEVRALTWDGHEFLDAARDDARWFKAKSVLTGVGGFSAVVLKEVLVGMLRQAVQAHV